MERKLRQHPAVQRLMIDHNPILISQVLGGTQLTATCFRHSGQIASTISGAWRNSRIPDVRRLIVSSTVSFMLNHARLDLCKLADDQCEIGVRKNVNSFMETLCWFAGLSPSIRERCLH